MPPRDQPYDLEQASVHDIADYIQDMAGQLAELARGAGLAVLAGDLDRVRDLASASVEGIDAGAPGRATG